MELFNTLSPSAFSAELPEGILASPFRSLEEKSISIRLLNTTDALIVKDKDNLITRADTVEWKKWQGGDGIFYLTLSPAEKITEAFFTDLSGRKDALLFEQEENNIYRITLPAGKLVDFGMILLRLA